MQENTAEMIEEAKLTNEDDSILDSGARVGEDARSNTASEEQVPLLSDSPSKFDLLHYADYRDALISVIDGLSTETPLTIGVFGEWGSGKTTLLGMVQDRLIERERLRKRSTQTIWVNIWQYGNEEDIWAAFLQSLLLKVRKEMSLLKRSLFYLGILRRQVDWSEVSKRL